MKRTIAILGAPSSIGIRPYADGTPRRLDLTPGVLREAGLVLRLDARDLGDLPSPLRYQDVERPKNRPRNDEDLIGYSRNIAERIGAAWADDTFVILLGGDCSILLGALLGFRGALGAPVSLAYVDAHADFATLESSPSGSAASMCLALATGRNDTKLARLNGDEPLIHIEDVVHIGRRDDAEPCYGHATLTGSGALNIPHAAVRERGTFSTAQAALEHVAREEGGRFWIHVDADVLDPEFMPAVDSPLAGGLTLDELKEILSTLANDPRALGLQLTIYDPTLDSDRACASRLVGLLEAALRGIHTHSESTP
jgi:arginase